MKSIIPVSTFLMLFVLLTGCSKKADESATRIIFLHHSTGLNIWGVENSLATSVAFRMNVFYKFIGNRADLPMRFKQYNKEQDTNYHIEKRVFPTRRPYGWYNGPYNYYNIWVKNAGDKPYMKQPTLEILTRDYEVIIFKHCYPVSNIQPDNDSADIHSKYKSIANYKLQYEAIKKKLHEFPDTKFILWTGAAQVKMHIKEDQALRAREFFNWVKEEWDEPGDNIHLWDLYNLETEGDLYFKEAYATAPDDSHPNAEFSSRVNKLLFQRIVDVIENDGKNTSLTGTLNP